MKDTFKNITQYKNTVKFSFFVLVAGVALLVLGGLLGGFDYKDDTIRSQTFDYTDSVSAVYFDVDMAQVNVVKGDNLKLVVNDFLSEYLEIKNTSEVLTVNYNAETRFYGPMFNHYTLTFDNGFVYNPIPKMTLKVPENLLKTLDINTSLGDVKVAGISVDNLNVDMSFGRFIGTDVTAKSTVVKSSLGDIDFYNFYTDNLIVDTSYGDTEYNGDIYKNGSFDSSLGDIELNLKGNYENYAFDVDLELGDLEIDGRNTRPGNYNSNGNVPIKVDSSNGSVDINTFSAGNYDDDWDDDDYFDDDWDDRFDDDDDDFLDDVDDYFLD
jgi:hypothetical protein